MEREAGWGYTRFGRLLDECVRFCILRESESKQMFYFKENGLEV
jgi:hypothetical protein